MENGNGMAKFKVIPAKNSLFLEEHLKSLN
jgi:hypothetical protein